MTVFRIRSPNVTDLTGIQKLSCDGFDLEWLR